MLGVQIHTGWGIPGRCQRLYSGDRADKYDRCPNPATAIRYCTMPDGTIRSHKICEYCRACMDSNSQSAVAGPIYFIYEGE